MSIYMKKKKIYAGMKHSIWWIDAKCFNCDTVNYLCWERIPNIHDSIEEKLLRFIRSKIIINYLKAIVTSGVCEIGSYIVNYVNIVQSVKKF